MRVKRTYRAVILLAAVYLTMVGATIYRFRNVVISVPSIQSLCDGSWAEEVEDSLEEHLGFREILFRMKTRTELFIGEKMIQGVYITDEMLLEKVSSSSPPDEQTAEVLGTFYETYHLPTYLVLVPSAIEIYENKLPRNAVRTEQESSIRAIYTAVGTNIRCIDACNALSAASDAYIYYRTDSHWTSYGAYCVYQAAMRKMGFKAISYDRYVISHLSTDFRGDLYERTMYDKVKADLLDCYTYEGSVSVEQVTAHYVDGRIEDRGAQLYDMNRLETEDMYSFYLGEPCQTLVIRTNLDNGKKLLLYKDGFGDCFVPFLLQHYSEICVVNLEQTGLNFEQAVDPSTYTQALFLSGMEHWSDLWEN